MTIFHKKRARGVRTDALPNNDQGSRILLVHWGRTGGGPRFTYELACALQDGAGFSNIALSISQYVDIAARFHRFPVTQHVRTYRTYREFVVGILRLPLIALEYVQFLRVVRPTSVIVTMESLYQSLILPVFTPRSIDYIVAVHDANLHPGEQNLVRRIGRYLEFHRADRFITFSEAIQNSLATNPYTRNRPVCPTVHPAYGTNGTHASPRSLPAGRKLRVGFLGRITEYKGLDLFAATIDRLRERNLDVVGVVYGAGDERYVSDIRDSPNCELHLGWIDDEEFPRTLATFDLLLLPYREASQSGVLAQALSLGVPVVVTPVGALAEQVADTGCGRVAEACTVAALTEATMSLLTHATTYGDCSRAGIDTSATTFSWARVARDISHFVA